MPSGVYEVPRRALTTAIVNFDYKSVDADEISLNKGDEIVNIEHYSDGWCTGMNKNTGKSGQFPVNFVEFKIPEAAQNESLSFSRSSNRSLVQSGTPPSISSTTSFNKSFKLDDLEEVRSFEDISNTPPPVPVRSPFATRSVHQMTGL